MTPRTTNRLILAGTLATLTLVAGCGGAMSTDGASSGTGSSAGGARSGSEVASAVAPAGTDTLGGGARANPAVMKRQVVATGSVAISARDLATPRESVDRIVADHHGFLADEQAGANRHGEPTHVRLVVRIPSTEFGTVMSQLSSVRGVRDSGRSSEDVTTQVIDVQQRVKAQRVGLDRVEALVSRAGSLTEVLALEKELTSRQAELDSLLQQQAYLADQTSLSTITVTLTRSAAPTPPRDDRPAGFWSGLHHGWHAFGLFVAGALTGVGAVLPFAFVLALVGIPAWLVLRRRRRAQPAG